MTLRKWFRLFWTTLLLGTGASLIAGLILVGMTDDFHFLEVSKAGFNLETIIFVVLAGSTISVVSQMGFFAYLIARYIAMGFLRSKFLWDVLQLLLVAIVFFDMIYLSYTSFAAEGESVLSYFILPTVLLLISALVSWWKVKATNKTAFISTLFFMYAVTVLEAIPALKLDNTPSHIFMLIPLLVSNAWQIMLLHKLVDNKKEAPVQASK
ncbi:KinB-signaling pathway activation protein [Paenibacillus sp. J2TS4]|uniref:KinB-signaling pathway activation protein n=1 Tax=Paenibacillus sp. J2TS4 TaxID=2807194 RepID=UPI001BCAC70B|nr:KinB-signaling pathway activation protein [Paenibacillus sp. J2TS4]